MFRQNKMKNHCIIIIKVSSDHVAIIPMLFIYPYIGTYWYINLLSSKMHNVCRYVPILIHIFYYISVLINILILSIFAINWIGMIYDFYLVTSITDKGLHRKDNSLKYPLGTIIRWVLSNELSVWLYNVLYWVFLKTLYWHGNPDFVNWIFIPVLEMVGFNVSLCL